MQTLKTYFARRHSLWRGLPALMLIAALAAPVLQAGAAAGTAAAATSQTASATITLFAPGAALGDPVWVEYGDGAGNWFKVEGWMGTLDNTTANLNVPYKQWTVFETNFGQGPFRWVVFNAGGASVWGVSDSFNLPSSGNINLTETIVPGVTGGTTPTATLPAGTTTTTAPLTTAATTTATATVTGTGTATSTATATPSATTTATVTGTTTATATSAVTTTATPAPSATSAAALQFTDNGRLLLAYGNGTASAISADFLGLPANSWIAVQWGDGLGNWETVTGWEGAADRTDATTGRLFKQWVVQPANYGQGPFRWAVFDRQGGTLLGFSASFNLPANGGTNLFISLSR